MNKETPKLKTNKPFESGLFRRLIAKEKHYKIGVPYIVKDGESFYNTDVIQREKVVFQY